MKTRGTTALREELARRGWTQADLARRLGVNSGVVANWLSGSRNPKIKWALELEMLLGLDVRLWAMPSRERM